MTKPLRPVPQPTGEDWGKIHALAWKNSSFRDLLEKDPTRAVKEYGEKHGKEFEKIVVVRPAPKDIPDEFLADVNPFPPSCC